MIVVFLVFLGCMSTLFFLSKCKYDACIKPLDKKEFQLKEFMPVAFYLLDTFRYRYNTGYDRWLAAQIAEVRGVRHTRFYLQAHWANKITLVLLGMLFLSLVGIGTAVDTGYGVFSIMLLGAIVYLTDRELGEKVKRRRILIQLDFPEFLNKLTLLVNAGLSVIRAWEKIVLDDRKDRPLYDELAQVITDIKAGKPEIKVYEEFAKRCRISEITKFISVVVQNRKKGNSELVTILRMQTNDCWEMRKNAARKLGEEASTKMLLPMMIMMIAILLIVATPAVLALKGI